MANYSILDTTKAQILYAKQTGTSAAYSTYIDPYTPTTADLDTFNVRMGVPSGNCLRVRNPSDSMELFFYMPTTHYKNIVMKYGTEASNGGSGQHRQIFSYSVDSGATWRTSGLSIPSDSAWANTFHLTTVSFSDTETRNNPRFVFRIRFQGNTTGTSGNNRFDNVSLEGDSIIIMPGAVPQVAVSPFSIAPNPAGNTITLTTAAEHNQYITITDIAGRTVLAATPLTAKENTINISHLVRGLYFVTVTNVQTKSTTTQRLIKE